MVTPRRIKFMLAEGLTELNRGNIERIAIKELAYEPRREIIFNVSYHNLDINRHAPLFLDRFAHDVRGLDILIGHSKIGESYVFWLDGSADMPVPVRVYDMQLIRSTVEELSEDPAWSALLHGLWL